MDVMTSAAIVILSSILGVASTRAILVGLFTIMSRHPVSQRFTLRPTSTGKAH